MDRQSSRGHKDHICSTKATLYHASTLKADIQNQVYVLTATLKKIEHELCLQIDRQCRAKLQGLEYLCENGKCAAACQNANTGCNGDGDDGFPKKSKLDKDFKTCMRLLQNYGQTRKFDFSKIMSWGSQVNKDDVLKEQVGTKENSEDSEELFEFVDSVECLLEEGQLVLRTLLKNDSKNSPEKLEDSEEALERASCSSVDSFDVIPNECCMNDSVCSNAQLPGIVRLPKLPETDCSKDNPGHPTFYLPNLQKRDPRDRTDLLSRIFKRSPSQKSLAKKSASQPVAYDKILPLTSQVTAEEMGQKICTNVPAATEVIDDVEVISSNFEAIAEQEMSTNPAENASPEERPAENNPANALQDSFKSYLQKKDLRTWVHPEPKANSYDNWVFKAAVPSSPKPLMELINASVSTESACVSDAVSSAFYRQLQAFVA